jgi:DNA repair exonuclease SbcCD ATPase subunit
LAQDCDLFFDLTPEKKMELFSETLELERWDLRSERAGEKQVQSEEQLVKLRAKKEATTASLAEINTMLAEAKVSADDWAARVRKEKRESTQRIANLQRDLELQEQRLNDAVLKEDAAATEVHSLRNEAHKLLNESVKAEQVYAEAKLNLQMAGQQATTTNAALAKLKTAKVCPTCGQPVKSANLAKHLRELEERLSRAEMVLAPGIPQKVKAAVTHYTQRMEATSSYIASFEAKQGSAQATVDRLRPEVERLRAELREARRTSETEETNPFQAQIRGLQDRRAELGDQLAGVEQDLSWASGAAERYRFWKRGFKDIKLQLIDEVLGELEVVTNGMLDEVGLGSWEVRYDIERETKSGTVTRALHVEICSPESKGKFVRWEAWSGGERQRLKLVGALALSDVLLAKAGVETNLEILDEPALYWSADGVQDLCAFLSDRAKQTNRSIFFVEHSASESAHFSNLITVVRDAKGAYIVND